MNELDKQVIRDLIYRMQESDEGFRTKEIRIEVRGEKERLSRHGDNIFARGD